MKPARQSNIELLRILTMCGVVLLHYNGGAGNALELVQPNTVNYWILMAVEALCICAVNVFLLISGYFGCTSQRRDPIRALELLVQVVAFQVAVYLPGALLGGSFSFGGLARNLIPTNYFVVLYIVVFLLSPYINILLKQLDAKQLRSLVILSLVLVSVLPTATDLLEAVTVKSFPGLNTIGLHGDGNGYTAINFLLMYVLGAYLRMAPAQGRKSWHLIVAGVISAGAVLVLSLQHPQIARAYCNPAVILLAVCVFELFRGFTVQSKVVNHLAKAAFTVFLFHTYPLSKLNVTRAVAGSPVYLLVHMLLASVGIYVISWVVYLVYDWVTKPVFRLLRKLLPKNEQ